MTLCIWVLVICCIYNCPTDIILRGQHLCRKSYGEWLDSWRGPENETNIKLWTSPHLCIIVQGRNSTTPTPHRTPSSVRWQPAFLLVSGILSMHPVSRPWRSVLGTGRVHLSRHVKLSERGQRCPSNPFFDWLWLSNRNISWTLQFSFSFFFFTKEKSPDGKPYPSNTQKGGR